jgi:ATP-dependent DNA helicase RecG
MQGELSRADIQKQLGLKHLPHLRDAYLSPALAQGWIEYTRPEKPTSRLQKYRLTDAGRRLQATLQLIQKEA